MKTPKHGIDYRVESFSYDKATNTIEYSLREIANNRSKDAKTASGIRHLEKRQFIRIGEKEFSFIHLIRTLDVYWKYSGKSPTEGVFTCPLSNWEFYYDDVKPEPNDPVE